MAVRLILCVCELRVCSSWIQSWQIKSSSHCQSSSLKSLVVDRKSQREEWQEDVRRRASVGLKLLHFSLATHVVGVFHATEAPATTCHMVGDETSSIIVWGCHKVTERSVGLFKPKFKTILFASISTQCCDRCLGHCICVCVRFPWKTHTHAHQLNSKVEGLYLKESNSVWLIDFKPPLSACRC